MSARERLQRYRWLVLGGGACALSLLVAVVDAPGALGAWLVAFLFWGAWPVGSLILVMMMRLMPGPWAEQLQPSATAALLGLAPLALAALPLLLGVPALYPWRHGGGAYLNWAFFDLRSVAWLALCLGLAVGWLKRPASASMLASIGLVGLTLLHSLVLVDWAMSLEPGFHSSTFALYLITIQLTIALALLSLIHLRRPDPAAHPGIAGALLLSALLLGLYFAYMQYLVLWSGNLPAGAAWYARRSTGLWAAIAWISYLLQVACIFALFFPPLRRGRRALIVLASIVLPAKALELAWLVLPALRLQAPTTAVALLLAMIGLGLLCLGAVAVAQPLRPAPQRARP